MKRFSTRINIAVLTVTATLFIAIFNVLYFYSRHQMSKDSIRLAENAQTMTNLIFSNVFNTVETSINMVAYKVIEDLDNPDEMFDTTKRLIELNPMVDRCVIAFVPGYYPQKGELFSPYAYRLGDTIISDRQLHDSYNYLTSDWYTSLMSKKSGSWSNPYFDKPDDKDKMMMITYSSPVFDKEGNICAIINADLSLEWLMKTINEHNPFEHSLSLLLGEEEVGVVYDMESKSLVDNIFSWSALQELYVKEMQFEIKSKKEDLKNESMETVSVNGLTYYVFSSKFTVPTNLMVFIICPYEDIFGNLLPMTFYSFLLTFGGLILLLIISTKIINRMTRPIMEFSVSAQSIAEGDFNSKLPKITSGDEMQQLAESFEYMQSSLVSYIEELKESTAANEHIKSELAIAHNIQMGMLPKVFPPFPDRTDIDIYAYLQPAKEVGGDLYDYFIRDEKLFFIIGDVAGKGVPASLLMAVTRSLFRSVSYQTDEPDIIMGRINTSILDTNDLEVFITLYVGVLNLQTGQLSYCNAGHNPLILITDRQPKFMKVYPNLPVGIIPDYKYAAQQIKLERNTTLVLYTDGLTEAENEDLKLYGDNRLFETIASSIDKKPKAMIDSVIRDVQAFVENAEQSDDITLMIISYKE